MIDNILDFLGGLILIIIIFLMMIFILVLGYEAANIAFWIIKMI